MKSNPPQHTHWNSGLQGSFLLMMEDHFQPFYVNRLTGKKDTPRYMTWFKVAKTTSNIAAFVLLTFSLLNLSGLAGWLRRILVAWMLVKLLEVLKDVLPFFDSRQRENKWMAVMWWQCLCTRVAGAQLWDKWWRYISSVLLSPIMAITTAIAFFTKPDNFLLFPLTVVLAIDAGMGAYVCILDECIVDRSLTRNRPDIELEIEDIEDAALGMDDQHTVLLGREGGDAWKKLRAEEGLQPGLIKSSDREPMLKKNGPL